MNKIDELTKDYTEKDLGDFRVGDTVKVYYKIKEGDKTRIQPYEGTVIAFRNHGVSKTFTVRKISYGVGVERIFPYYSPNVEKVEVLKRGKVRRAKLYYLRKYVGKKAKVKEKK
ncbi:MAG: 50S ribosomal protein L19 [Spirochaetes bacterium]|nr:50S ribosomal protein L19 [Spirochaetota bacterium]